MALADAGTSNDDASYTGDTGDSAMSLQYYRNKAAEFQGVMNALDSAAQALQMALNAGLPDEEAARLQAKLDEFNNRKFVFRATAEAINAAASVINAAGGRFQELSIPTGLGFLPAIPIAAVAAIATAATLIVWGRDWIASLQLQHTLDSISDPAARDQVAKAVAMALAAGQVATDSPLGSLASLVKWGAIAALAFFAYRAFAAHQSSQE